MGFKSYSEIKAELLTKYQKILYVYLMAAPNEQQLRFTWDLCKAMFQGRESGYLVELEKAKAKAKERLGILLNGHELNLLGYTTLQDDIDRELAESDQQNIEAYTMEEGL